MSLHDRLISAFLLLLLAAPGVFVALFALEGTLERADFVFVNRGEVTSLDPAVCTAIPEGRVIMAVSEGLTTLEPGSLRPAPAAARSWTVSPDGLIYEFRLREALRWSDGTPLCAAPCTWP